MAEFGLMGSYYDLGYWNGLEQERMLRFADMWLTVGMAMEVCRWSPYQTDLARMLYCDDFGIPFDHELNFPNK